jgi:hypothetical protein
MVEEPETISLLDEDEQEIAGTSRPFVGYDQDYLWSPLDMGWSMPFGITVTGARIQFRTGDALDLPFYYPAVNDGRTAYKLHAEEPESEEVH